MVHFVHTSQLKGIAHQIADEGFSAGLTATGASPTFVNPYGAVSGAGGLAAELYAEGFQKGLNKRDNDAAAERGRLYAEKCRREAEERQLRLMERLVGVLGDEELVEELFDHIKELIREETAPRSDY